MIKNPHRLLCCAAVLALNFIQKRCQLGRGPAAEWGLALIAWYKRLDGNWNTQYSIMTLITCCSLFSAGTPKIHINNSLIVHEHRQRNWWILAHYDTINLHATGNEISSVGCTFWLVHYNRRYGLSFLGLFTRNRVDALIIIVDLAQETLNECSVFIFSKEKCTAVDLGGSDTGRVKPMRSVEQLQLQLTGAD